jgi:hypothetical protein
MGATQEDMHAQWIQTNSRWLLLSSRDWRSQDYVAADTADTAANIGMMRKTLFLTAKYLGVLSYKNTNSLSPQWYDKW